MTICMNEEFLVMVANEIEKDSVGDMLFVRILIANKLFRRLLENFIVNGQALYKCFC